MSRFLNYTFAGIILGLLVGVPSAYLLWQRQHYRNFHVVREGVLYRSGQLPVDSLKRLIHDHGIKTVITLRSAHAPDLPAPDAAEELFCKVEQVRYFRLRHLSWADRENEDNEKSVPADANVRQFLQIMRDPRNHPVLIHCFAGIHRTGTFCAIYRMEFEHWSPAQAMHEMKQLGYAAHHRDVFSYLENYKPHGSSVEQGVPVAKPEELSRRLTVPECLAILSSEGSATLSPELKLTGADVRDFAPIPTEDDTPAAIANRLAQILSWPARWILSSGPQAQGRVFVFGANEPRRIFAPPDHATIMRAMAPVQNIPFVHEVSRENYRFRCEMRDDGRWKCTVTCTETVTSWFPIPYQETHRHTEVVHVNVERLVPVTVPTEVKPKPPAADAIRRPISLKQAIDAALENGAGIGQGLDDLDQADRLCFAVKNLLSDSTIDNIYDRMTTAHDALLRCKVESLAPPTGLMQRTVRNARLALDQQFLELNEAIAYDRGSESAEVKSIVERMVATSSELRELIEDEIVARMRESSFCKNYPTSLLRNSKVRSRAAAQEAANIRLNVEVAYWKLFQAQGNVECYDQLLHMTQKGWIAYSRGFEKDGRALKEYAPVMAKMAELRGNRMTALGAVLDAERNLRGIMGIKAEDGTRLVPSTAPQLAYCKPDLRFIAQFEPVSRIALNGDGTMPKDGTAAPIPTVASKAANSLASNDFTGSTSDLEQAAVRQARLELNQNLELLKDQEEVATRILCQHYQKLPECYKRLETATTEDEFYTKAFKAYLDECRVGKGGGGSPDVIVLLQQIAPARLKRIEAIAEYNSELAFFEWAKGTLTQYQNSPGAK